MSAGLRSELSNRQCLFPCTYFFIIKPKNNSFHLTSDKLIYKADQKRVYWVARGEVSFPLNKSMAINLLPGLQAERNNHIMNHWKGSTTSCRGSNQSGENCLEYIEEVDKILISFNWLFRLPAANYFFHQDIVHQVNLVTLNICWHFCLRKYCVIIIAFNQVFINCSVSAKPSTNLIFKCEI